MTSYILTDHFNGHDDADFFRAGLVEFIENQEYARQCAIEEALGADPYITQHRLTSELGVKGGRV